jgi:hypothetical protein
VEEPQHLETWFGDFAPPEAARTVWERNERKPSARFQEELLQVVQQGPLQINFEQVAGSGETQDFQHHGIANENPRSL